MIAGAAGVGKTTLGKELSKRLNFQHLDLDDYYFRWDTEIPYSESPPHDEIRECVMKDITKLPNFVMSGTIGSILWDLVNPLFELAVLLSAPADIRRERLRARAFVRYGERVLLGGDMYEEHQKFYADVELYDTGTHPTVPVTLERHERWAAGLNCPVLRLDGTKSIYENTAWITTQYLLIKNN
jgi:adenylate kinase family enzyme